MTMEVLAFQTSKTGMPGWIVGDLHRTRVNDVVGANDHGDIGVTDVPLISIHFQHDVVEPYLASGHVHVPRHASRQPDVRQRTLDAFSRSVFDPKTVASFRATTMP